MRRTLTSGPITSSILLGLCMGSGAAISMQYGSGEYDKMRQSVFQSFVLIAGMALVLNLLVYLGLDGILWVLRVPEELKLLMKDYLVIIFLGITATFLYNYFANLLRAIGNSVVPLVFLAASRSMPRSTSTSTSPGAISSSRLSPLIVRLSFIC